MRGTTKQRLHALVDEHIAEIYSQAGHPIPGVGDDPDATEPDLFGGITLENIRSMLDVLGQANVIAVRMVGPRFLRHPFKRDAKTGRPVPLIIDHDILAACFTLTEKQHAELDPRALRIAQKYSHKMPDWLKRHLDLYMLCGMYIKYTGENALTAMKTQIKRDIAVAQQATTKQPKSRPIDSDQVTTQPEPVTETVDTYPEPAAGNGGMAAEL
jgi:hypothetical protein